MRRLCIFLVFFLMSLPAVHAAKPLDPKNDQDALTINRKIMCSTVDGKAMTYTWNGRAYSRRQGERDRLLFLVEGMNIRACVADKDDKRGNGFRLVSREILLYQDPETGAVLSKWDNPWSGETVDVLHVANDPVNFGLYEMDRSGQPLSWGGKVSGHAWWSSTTVPLFYPNPLASEYQSEIGGIYHATEMFNFFGESEDLLDRSKTEAKVTVGWSRFSDWLPWMKMSGREGTIYMHTAGRKLESWDQLSDLMKRQIKQHYPEYNSAPPLDDQRRNETSWLYYKRVRDGERTAPQR